MTAHADRRRVWIVGYERNNGETVERSHLIDWEARGLYQQWSEDIQRESTQFDYRIKRVWLLTGRFIQDESEFSDG